MIVFGRNVVQEAIRSRLHQAKRVWVQEKARARNRSLHAMAVEEGIPVEFSWAPWLQEAVAGHRHQGVAADLGGPPYLPLEEMLESDPKTLLLLDAVVDPRNLGAVIRSAEATAVEGILLPTRRSSPLTSVAIQASAGAALHLPISRINNTVQVLKRLKNQGFWVVGLDASGTDSLASFGSSSHLAFVVGGEDRGLRTALKKECDFFFSIPMLGKIGSLNLSVACAVTLYRLLYWRRTKPTPGAGENDNL